MNNPTIPNRINEFKNVYWAFYMLVILTFSSNFIFAQRDIVVKNTNKNGENSFIWAIQEANSDEDLNTIKFDLDGNGIKTIDLDGGGMTITNPLFIDGTSLSNYSAGRRHVVIKDKWGMTIQSSKVKVKGLELRYGSGAAFSIKPDDSGFQHEKIEILDNALIYTGNGQEDGVVLASGYEVSIRNNFFGSDFNNNKQGKKLNNAILFEKFPDPADGREVYKTNNIIRNNKIKDAKNGIYFTPRSGGSPKIIAVKLSRNLMQQISQKPITLNGHNNNGPDKEAPEIKEVKKEKVEGIANPGDKVELYKTVDGKNLINFLGQSDASSILATTANAAGEWSINGLSLSNGDKVFAYSYDNEGNSTPMGSVKTFDGSSNGDPEVKNPIPNDTHKRGDTIEVSSNLDNVFEDPDGDPLNYSVKSDDESIAKAWLEGKKLFIRGMVIGGVDIKATASDGTGSVDNIFKREFENYIPEVKTAIPDKTLAVDESWNFNLNDHFYDKDGDLSGALTFSLEDNSNANVAEVVMAGAGGGIEIKGAEEGSTTIVIKATDPNGANITDEFVVTVVTGNVKPKVKNPIPDAIEKRGDTITVSANLDNVFEDDDNDALSYSVESEDDAKAKAWIAGKTLFVRGLVLEKVEIRVTADDNTSGTATDTFSYEFENHQPTVKTAIPDKTLAVDESWNFNLNDHFYDKDGDLSGALTFSLEDNSNANVAEVVMAGAGGGIEIKGAEVGSTTIVIKATDPDGANITDEFVVTVVTGNVKPKVKNPIPDAIEKRGDTITVSANLDNVFEDDDNDALSYSVESEDDAKAKAWIAGKTLFVRGLVLEKVEIRVTADDNTSGTATDTFNYEFENHQPTVKKAIPDKTLAVDESWNFNLNDHFYDKDGDLSGALTFSLEDNSNANVAEVVMAGAGGGIEIKGAEVGSTTIVIKATDPDGANITDEFTVTVVTGNVKPKVKNPIPDAIEKRGDTITVSANLDNVFEDDDNDALSYRVESEDDAKAKAWIAGKTLFVRGLVLEEVEIRVTADDNTSGTATDTFNYEFENHQPTVKTAIPDKTLAVDESWNFNLNDHFYDKDGDLSGALTFSLEDNSNANVAEVVMAGAGGGIEIKGAEVGSTTIVIKATDPDGANITDEFTVTVVTGNVKPKVKNPIPDAIEKRGDTITVSANLDNVFEDDDNDALSYSVESEDDAKAKAWIAGKTLFVRGLVLEKVEIRVTADDNTSGTATDTFNYEFENHQPTVKTAIPDKTLAVDESWNFNLNDHFYDKDGDLSGALTFSLEDNSNANVAEVVMAGAGGGIEIKGAEVGSTTIVIKATDPDGANITDEFTVTVVTGNVKPKVKNPIPDAIEKRGDTITVSANLDNVFEDDDNDALSYSVESEDDAKAKAWIAGKTLFVRGLVLEKVEIRVTADDNTSGTATDTFSYEFENHQPTVKTAIPDKTLAVDESWNFNLNDHFYDKDGDLSGALTFSLEDNSNANVAEVVMAGAGGGIEIKGAEVGSTTIVIKATDPDGANITDEFTVTVVTGNVKPKVKNPIPDAIEKRGDTITVSANLDNVFEDDDNDALSYSVESEDDAKAKAWIAGKTLFVRGLVLEKVEIRVTADDNTSGTATDTFSYEFENHQPTVKTAIPDKTLAVDESWNFNLNDHFYDKDGDLSGALTFSLEDNSNANVAEVVMAGAGGGIEIKGAEVGSTTIVIKATDPNGANITDEFTVTVVTGNVKPKVKNPIPGAIEKRGDTITVSANLDNVFEDEDNDALSYRVESEDDTKAKAWIAGKTLFVRGLVLEEVEIRVTADDNTSGTATDTFSYEFENHQPTVKKAIPDKTLAVDESWNFNLNDHFYDKDGDLSGALTFSLEDNSNANVAEVVMAGAGGGIEIKGAEEGSTTIVIKATDPDGANITDEFVVTVEEDNKDPEVVNPIQDQTIEKDEIKEIPTAGVFSDPDGDPLTLSVVSLDLDIVTAELLTNNNIKIKGVEVGNTKVRLTANDNKGGITSTEFKVTVISVNRPPIVDNPIVPHEIFVDDSIIAANLLSVFSDPDGDILRYEVASRDPGKVKAEIVNDNQLRLIGVAVAQDIEVEVRAFDPSDANVANSFLVNVSLPNRPPTIKEQIEPLTLRVNEVWNEKFLKDLFTDLDGDVLSFTITSNDQTIATGEEIGEKLSIKGIAKGQTKINVKADDGKGGDVTMVIEVKVKENLPPLANNPIDDLTLNIDGDPFTKDLTDVFTDPDGDDDLLTFKGSQNINDIIEIDINGKNLTITPLKVGGAVTVTLTASDGELEGSTNFKVTVTRENQPPIVEVPIRDQKLREGRPGQAINLRRHFSDPDGSDNNLVFKILSNSNPAVVNATASNTNGRRLVLTPLSVGRDVNVCVEATDGEGKAQDCFIVDVYPKADPTKTIIESNKNEIAADGTSTAEIKIIVRDKDGNNIPVGNDTIEFNPPTLGTIGTPRDIGDGTYTANLRSSTTIGTSIITAKLNGVDITDDAKVKFITGGPDASKSKVIAKDERIIANGVDATLVTVKLYDIGGNPITVGGENVKVYTDGEGTISPIPATDNQDGTYTVTLTSSTKAGRVLVYARLNNVTISETDVVFFVPGPPDPSKSIIQARDAEIPADGSSYTIITATLFDAFGNRIRRGGHNVKLTTDAGTIGLTNDNLNGTYSARLTASTKVEVATVRGKLGNDQIGSSATVKFGSGSADPNRTIITSNKSEIEANGSDEAKISVKLFDRFGNPVQDGKSVVELTHTPAVLANLSPVTNNNDGTYEATLSALTVTGFVKIKGTVDGVEIPDSVIVELIAGPASELNSKIVSRLSAISADGVSTTEIKVLLYDENNNPLTRGGDVVKISTTKGTLLNNVIDNINGTYTQDLQSSTIEEIAELKGEVNGKEIESLVEVRFIKDVIIVDPSKSVLTVDDKQIVADGEESTDVLLKLYNTSGDPITSGNYTVDFEADKGVISDEKDNGDGTYSAKLTSSTVAEISTVTATVDGKRVDDQEEVEFIPGPVDVTKCNIIPQDRILPADGISNTKVIVQLKDKFGNRHKTGGETVNFYTSLGLIPEDARDNNNGTYEEILTTETTPGIAKVSGKVGGVPILDTAQVEFFEDLPADPTKSKIKAKQNEIVANGLSSTEITVTLFDKNGNQLNRGGDEVTLITTAGEITFDPEDNEDGTYTGVLVSSEELDTAFIKGKVNGVEISDEEEVRFIKSVVDASKSTITAQFKALPANGYAISLITVQLRDKDNVPITTGGDEVVLFTTGGLMGNPNDMEDGTYIGQLTADSIAQIVTITGTINGEEIGDKEFVEFVVGDPSPLRSLIVSNKKQILSDGQSQAEITVQLLDGFGNPLTEGGDTVRLSATKGTLPSEPVDNNDGTYTAFLTSSEIVETSIVTGTLNGEDIKDTEEVKFVEKIEIDPSLCFIEAEDTLLLANGISNTLVTIAIVDANGDQVDHGGDLVELVNTAGEFSGLTDQGDGTYTGTLTTSAVPDTAYLTGKVNNVDILDKETVYWVDNFPPDPTKSTIVSNKPKILADGKSKAKITVTLYDKDGNRVKESSHAVELDNNGKGELSNIVNNQDGTFEAILTSSLNPDTCIITGMLNGKPIIDSETVVFVEEVVADPSLTLITAAERSILADGNSTTDINIQVYDLNGDKKEKGGDEIILKTTAGSLDSIIPKDNNDGTYTAVLTSSTVIERALITGVLNGDDINDDEQVSFVEKVVIIDPKQSTINAKHKQLPADGTSATIITVQLFDINGNKVDVGGATVKLQTDLGELVLKEAHDNNDGTYIDTLISATTEGDAFIRGHVNGELIHDFAKVEFKHDVVLVDPSQCKILVNPTRITADGKSRSKITIVLYDGDGERITKGGNKVVMNEPGAGKYSVSDRVAKDNGNGTYSIELISSNQVEVASIKGTIDGDEIGDSGEVEFYLDIVADPKTSTIESDKAELLADGTSIATITVKLIDTNGDPILVDENEVTLDLTPKSLGKLGPLSFKNGVYVAKFTTGVNGGTVTVTGTLNGVNIADNAKIRLVEENGGEVEVPEGFSPNGDQINDVLVIPGIIGYPQSKLVIFNRWGSEVFSARGYQNNWDGRSTGMGNLGGGSLPNGTYFYVLDLGIGKGPIKGYLYISR